ncbi:MAG: hypothetical protein N2485_08705, partial [bacterium]|nr:hypothetical protein [bacterium]
MPTIVDLLGIKTEFYTTGNNIFDKTDKNNYVIFKDGSFVYNDFYYNRNSEDLYDLKHGIYFKPTKEDKKIIQKMKKIKEANDSYILIRNKLK